MPHGPSPRAAKADPANDAGTLALETLQLAGLLPAVLPVHVVIPASGVLGSTLQPDGGVQIYGIDSGPLPGVIVISPSSQAVLPSDTANGQKEWTVSPDGRLLGEPTLILRSAICTAECLRFHRMAHGSSVRLLLMCGRSRHLSSLEAREQRRYSRRDSCGSQWYSFLWAASNSGAVIYTTYVGADVRYFAWSASQGILPLKSLYAQEENSAPNATQFSLQAISGDGKTIVGFSGGGALPARVTVWVDGVASQMPAGGHESSYALSVSDDGQVIGGYVADGGIIQSAVWVEGQLKLLTTEAGLPASDEAMCVVHGGGNPHAWAALSWSWIATSDGVVHSFFGNYLPEHYGLSLTGGERPISLMADDQAVYIVYIRTNLSRTS